MGYVVVVSAVLTGVSVIPKKCSRVMSAVSGGKWGGSEGYVVVVSWVGGGKQSYVGCIGRVGGRGVRCLSAASVN